MEFQDLAKMTFSKQGGVQIKEKPVQQVDRSVPKEFGSFKDDTEKTVGQINKSQKEKGKSSILRKAYKYKRISPTLKTAINLTNARVFKAKYIRDTLRDNNKLPFKHYALEGDSKGTEIKTKELFKQRNNLGLKYQVGYNNDAHSNIVWNIPGGWFAYGSENYVIIS